MNRIDIEILVKNLKWNLPESIQLDAIEKLHSIDNEYIRMLVLPINKDYWDNAAKILVSIGYPRVLNAFPDILEWIADPNWPGYDLIYDLITQIDKEVLAPYIKQAILKAQEKNDEIWEMRLVNILELS